MKTARLLTALVVLALPSLASAQQRMAELGLPIVRNFAPKEYGGGSQIYAVAQDRRGVMYFGAERMILEYDGATWRRISVPSDLVTAIAVDAAGRIWVGAIGNIGYLEPDASATMQYVSIVDKIPLEHRSFSNVHEILTSGQGVFFKSYVRLFRWDGKRMHVWVSNTRFQALAEVRGRVYTSQQGVGLQEIDKDELRELPGGGAYKNSIRLSLHPFDARRMLVSAQRETLTIYDGERVKPFPTSADDYIRKSQIYSSTRIGDGNFCINTLFGGAVILKPDGQIQNILDKEAGLPNLTVLAAYTDLEGNLWLGRGGGITRVQDNARISFFSLDTASDIARYGDSMYGASDTGGPPLFRIVRNSRTRMSSVQQLPSPFSQTFALLSYHHPDGKVPDQLLAATSIGMMKIEDGAVSPAVPGATGVFDASRAAVQSRISPDRIVYSRGRGLFSMRWEAGKWIDEGTLPDFSGGINSLAEAPDGSIWAAGRDRRVLRVHVASTGMAASRGEILTAKDGLTEGGSFIVTCAAGEIFVIPAPTRNILRWDGAQRKLIPDNRLLLQLKDTDSQASLFELSNGDVWAVNRSANEQRQGLFRRQADGTYQLEENPYRQFSRFGITRVRSDPDGTLWIAGSDGLVRFDPRVEFTRKSVSALVRRVSAGPQSVLFGGTFREGAPGIRLPYEHNSIQFEFAAPTYVDEAETTYQYILDGADSDWSGWGKQKESNYASLAPGKYTFRVRARALDGRTGEESVYSFVILPPWHRTWWAYGLYGIVLLTGIGGTDRVMRRRVIARERERSMLREAELRAETEAAKAKTLQAENERNKNVELLSEIGKELTSSLDLDTIFFRLHQHVNQLMDASVFGVGIYHPERKEVEYRLVVIGGDRCAPCTRGTRDRNHFQVWCIENRKPVFLNDVPTEYTKYIEIHEEPRGGMAGGSASSPPRSMVYLPLIMKDRVLGVITVQSSSENAYTEHHLYLLANLAAYTSIALDNADAYHHLKSAQDQLVVQEKLASLGALTAGIAHEIKNPLNFVNNFAELSVELMAELREDLHRHRDSIPAKDFENIEALIDDLSGNAKKISEHGGRADDIVRSMLLHSRGHAGERQPTDINSMLEENVNLVYHGMRAQDPSFNVRIEREFAGDVGKVDAVPEDLSRVFLNILNNACYALSDKARKSGADFVPVLRVRTVNLGDSIEVRIRDNGTGIAPEVRARIFNPFFTTKPTGQGTGLGLSISHEIVVQQHGGQLEVETETGQYAEFVVRLRRQGRKPASG